MTTEKKKPAPVLVAVFPSERPAWEAVAALEKKGVGRDFIGLRLGAMPVNGYAAVEEIGPSKSSLLSVLAPSRLTEDVRTVLTAHGASMIDEHRAVAPIFGSVPHPGTLEDHDLKLPMGLEFPDNSVRRARAAPEAAPASAPVADAVTT
jgi:hypothetical protein